MIGGLWTLAVPSVLGYALGCPELRTTSRVVLEVLADDTIWDGRSGALQQCIRRGAVSVYAPLRWVVRGARGSTKMPVKVMSVNVLLPSVGLLDFVMRLRARLGSSIVEIISSFLEKQYTVDENTLLATRSSSESSRSSSSGQSSMIWTISST